MRSAALLVSGLLVGAVVGAAIGTHSTPTVAATPTAIQAFDPHVVTVAVTYFPIDDDPTTRDIAVSLRASLTPLWSTATLGRSRVVVQPSQLRSDVLLIVDGPNGVERQMAWHAALPWARIIVIHEIENTPMTTYSQTALHELGHALGCCAGAGSDGADHEAGCPKYVPNETRLLRGGAIMCALAGDALTFNDYELAQMGL